MSALEFYGSCTFQVTHKIVNDTHQPEESEVFHISSHSHFHEFREHGLQDTRIPITPLSFNQFIS